MLGQWVVVEVDAARPGTHPRALRPGCRPSRAKMQTAE